MQEFEEISENRRTKGSRFGVYPLTKRICSMTGLAETGQKNRRLLGTTRRLVSLLVDRTESLGKDIALGNSREPPTFTFPGRNA